MEGDDEDEEDGAGEGQDVVTKVGSRRGVCPITGVEVAPGELRRVLV